MGGDEAPRQQRTEKIMKAKRRLIEELSGVKSLGFGGDGRAQSAGARAFLPGDAMP